MTTFLHIKPRHGVGFLMIRERIGNRLSVLTGQDGVQLNREEAQSLQRAVERWLQSQTEKEVES